jgi:tight adherence protein B
VSAFLPLVVGLLTFVAVAHSGRRRTAAAYGRRVSAYVAPRHLTPPRLEEQMMISRYERTVRFAEQKLERLPRWQRFTSLVERADAPLRPVELVWTFAGGAALLGLVFAAAGASLLGFVLLVLAAAVAVRIWLGVRIKHRRDAFEEQLPELLMSLGSALRAGHGLVQALNSVADDSPEPVAGELRRVLTEARLGRPLDAALEDLGKRIDSADLEFVLDAVIVQRQVGGSLAGIFDIVGESVRQRQQFALRIKSLTAMGRTSALVLTALPFALGAFLSLMNHAYLAPLFAEPVGRAMVLVSVFLLCVGGLWLRRIVGYRG